MLWLRRLGKCAFWIVIFCLVGGFFFYLTSDFWTEQFRAWAIGSIEIEADDTGRDLPNVDQVEVMLLGGIKHPDQGFAEGRLSDYNITGQATLQGDDAKKAADLWRWIPRGKQYMDLCFNPVYALRFKQGNKLLLETSVCWGCHIYTIPIGPLGRWGGNVEYGFDADSKPAQELLQLLEKKVPIPKKGTDK